MPRTSLLVSALLMLTAAALAVGQAKDTKAPAKKPTANAQQAAGDVKKGKQVYEDFCGVCHFSTNRAKKIGPGLRGIYRRGKFADGKKADDPTMREWVIKGGVDMPSFEDTLTKEQIEDLLAYLKTI